MKTDARRLSAAPIALAAALLTAFLVLVSPLSASAHDSLISSSPEAGGTVDTLPSELTLTFSAKLIDAEGATEVVVTDASGASVTDGPATVNGAVVTQPLVAEAAAGEYDVTWRVVSSDGHPISETFGFTVATSTLTGATTAPESTPTAEPTEPAQTAAPAPTAESTGEPIVAEEPSASTAWIWILAIAGIVILAVAVVVAFALKGRGSSPSGHSPDAPGGDSGAPSER